eukprot:CAMPEP_0180281724 /NCGR_PEP_ID=MMETSP0988-20121125/9377_1 /TAXON_ID=697907 /ORGANISM="non described non described, Strain CCMP2293" /LENGTH=57 /DNA_ID=CAMNT_0022253773 /DNA_START=294 /DNA_END=464 /DNA_ORIENTATION=-
MYSLLTASSGDAACHTERTPGVAPVRRKEAWLFCRTSSDARLCCQLEEPKGPKGLTD